MKAPQKKSSLFSVLKPYTRLIVGLIVLAVAGNALNLILPKLVSHGIDGYTNGTLVMRRLVIEFGLASMGIFIFTYLQSIVQTFASERVARDIRTTLAAKISRQSYQYIETANPAKLLSTLTGDVDSIKMFVAQAIVSLISSIVLIVGSIILLEGINWRLATAVLLIIPIIGGTFFFVLSKVRPLFLKTRSVIDKLNKVINESILGAALIRVLNSQTPEYQKFFDANTEAKNTGLQILGMFATLIPIITFVANLALLTILALGGHYVILGSMTLGEFAAFNSYVSLLIFPILIIGFMSNVIAQAQASYERITLVTDASEPEVDGLITTPLLGAIELLDVSVRYGEKYALKEVSFSLAPGTKTAIIGPTAAGKTQLLYLLTALLSPTEGNVQYDTIDIKDYHPHELHKQIGFVFQDSIIFNMSVRENIAFSDVATDASLEKAIETAELTDFIKNLPDGLSTIVSERGGSLSGGQKQRIMLARALALDPKVLLLDDFTARVDTATEARILANISKNYPNLTLVSVTQKIAAIESYDKIIVLMEGELLAEGTHQTLMETSPEYVQIYNSQRSTNEYELQS